MLTEVRLNTLRRRCTACLWIIVLASAIAQAQTTTPSSDRPTLPFGTQGLDIPVQPVELGVSARSIELLGKAFQVEKGSERIGYARELGTCGKPGLKYLLDALAANDSSNADPQVNAESIRSVGLIGDASALPHILPFLQNEDASVRREAVLAAAALGGNSSITSALDDHNESVQSAALSVANSPNQANHIAGLLPTLPDRLKPYAATALGRTGAVQHEKELVSMLQSDVAARSAAIQALGQLKASGYGAAIVAMLKDPSPTVRRVAMLELPNVTNSQSQQSLAIATLNDPDPTVREAAAHVLQSAPTVAAIEPLRAQLADSYEPLHLAARQALATAGAPVIPIAESMLSDANPRRREDGSFLLGAYASSASIDRHIALLEDSDWAVAAQAAKSLHRLSPSADVVGPHLLGILSRARQVKNESPPMLDAQASALLLAGRLRYAPIIDPARRMIPSDPNSADNASDQLRTAAIWAIGMTAQPDSAAAAEVRAVYKNQFQSGSAVFESFKALFNMHDAGASATLKNWDSDPQIGRDNACRWMAHYICDYAGGVTTPFVPRPAVTNVELSIQDLPGK